MRRLILIMLAASAPAVAWSQVPAPEPVVSPAAPASTSTEAASPVTPAPTSTEAPPPAAPNLAPCTPEQLAAATAPDLGTRPPSTAATVTGVGAGVAGQVAGAAVAGPVGAAIGGVVAGTAGRMIASAVGGEDEDTPQEQAERAAQAAAREMRWCTADGRLLSETPAPEPQSAGSR